MTYLLISFDFNAFLEILKLILEIGGLIGVFLTLFTIYDLLRPKIKNKKIVMSYINFETDELVQESEFQILWPHIPFLKTIRLPKIARNAKYEIAYRSAISPKTPLGLEHYTDEGGGKYRKIKLMDKAFFLDNEVEYLYLICMIPQSSGYKEKISEEREENQVTVLNHNLEEVRNYRLTLLTPITMDRASQYFPFVESFVSGDSDLGEAHVVALILKPLDACRSGVPGRIVIPFE